MTERLILSKLDKLEKDLCKGIPVFSSRPRMHERAVTDAKLSMIETILFGEGD